MTSSILENGYCLISLFLADSICNWCIVFLGSQSTVFDWTCGSCVFNNKVFQVYRWTNSWRKSYPSRIFAILVLHFECPGHKRTVAVGQGITSHIALTWVVKVLKFRAKAKIRLAKLRGWRKRKDPTAFCTFLYL